MPSVFPGGYLYFSDITGYQVGENITGGTSNATGTILRLDSQNNRIVVKRSSANANVFQTGETITGSNSSTAKANTNAKVSPGTGAKIYAWSSQIGGVDKLTITNTIR